MELNIYDYLTIIDFIVYTPSGLILKTINFILKIQL